MGDSQHIVLFSEGEERILAAIRETLVRLGKAEELEQVDNNRISLETLARSISLYPSILESHRLGNSSRSIESLIESLCQREVPDMILHIPTKAILGRGFSIAKINFIIMLRYLIGETAELAAYGPEILSHISHNVFTLTAEEVYISILEDISIPRHIRSNAVFLLAHTWEYRLGYGVREFAPILQSIWKAREKLIPNFGTMLGFSELFLLSEHTETNWFDFLMRDELSEEEIFALEEFIFGLTFEEIATLRGKMAERGKTSLDQQEARGLLGQEHLFPDYTGKDPRELYRSFRDRKMRARYRARARIEGPKKTLEEYLMCFLLSQPETPLTGAEKSHA
jgi:hypothetical protein